MIDSNLKELLRSLKRINELSNEAINELTQLIEKNEPIPSNENSSLTNSIVSLNKEVAEAKKLHGNLLPNRSEESVSINVDTCNQDLGVESTENTAIKSSEDLSEQVDSNLNKNPVETVGELPKETNDELCIEDSGCNGEPHSIENGLIKAEVSDRPLLKIVDFNKLVDPRNLELMDKNEKRKDTNGDTSIIVLSSSDDEPVVEKNLQENIEKHTNKPKESLKNVHISTSSVISTSQISKKNRTNTIKQVQQSNHNAKSSNTYYMAIKNDKKFSCKAYVKLLRVPCEEMKNFYSNNQDINEYRKDSERKSCHDSSDILDSNTSKQKETSKSSSESDTDLNKEAKELNDKTKFEKKGKKNIVESSDEEIQSSSIKGRNRVFSKRKLKISSGENSDSSEDESKKTMKRNHEKNKHKERCNSNDTKKSKYVLSDDENSTSEVNGEEKINEHSNQFVEENTSKDKSDSENSEKESEDTEKNSLQSQNKRSTENIDLSDDAEDEVVGKRIEDSDDDQSSHEKEKGTNEEIVINSDDSENSDFDTFFKKNKVARNVKRIKTLNSDSEDDQNDKKEDIESGKESIQSENQSDKEEDEGKIRKRKRIKEIKDDSSDSDEAITRKKIKKVISKDSLSVKTKKAAAEERERKQRILEKQKKYNQIYESSDIANSKVEKLVLDVDTETEQPLLEVDKALVSKLKPHQASGIQFMWDACFESLKRTRKSQGSGCILAHCMGLGKTLQVIALTDTLLEEEKTKVKKVLIVTPLSTVLNWKAEFKNWLSGGESYEVYELVSVKAQNAERSCYVREWHERGGVMIISYAMFRNLSNEKNKKINKKFRTIFVEGLVDPGPDLVICDEGHLLKNEKTSLSIAMNKIKTRRRIVLTGTPLQNNLKEYYCMVQFVKPNLLGTYREYLNRFVNPITNGQYTDSTQYDINLMRRRSHVLHKLLDGIVQRRDYSVLSPYLPPKFEYVLFLTLSETQKKLYKHYMDNYARNSEEEGSTKTSFLFKDFQALSRICIHPRVLLDKSNDDQLKYQSDEESIGSLKDFIDDDESSTQESSESESNSDTKKSKKRVTKRITRAQKNNPIVESGSEEEEESENVKKEWWQEYCDGEELDNIAHSTKLLLLFEILKECEQIGDKVLLFSQSLYALNLIEYFLGKVDEATQNGDADEKTCGYTGSWSPGVDYFRLDGSTNCSLRSEWCNTFNKETNTRARLFLLSTKAGGLGINLVAANRVILFDVSWNPSSDVQSIYRVYRFGQLKPSYIYRFVVYGAMEMKIYERQVTKQAISKRVIDEQQIDRHYNQNDLAELYKFEEPELEVRPTPLVPKDVLLGEMLINHEDKIYKYHEHQSLLENKEDETLNEEERKAAWDEFENEKVDRTKQHLIGKFSVNTVQLALRSIIQRDNPTWNNSQILSIIPQLIQQLNLQLSLGDQTMYNRIAAEIKVMQDDYTRKMQLQFYQYRLQLAQNQMQNAFQPQFSMMNLFGNRLPPPNMANFNPSGSNFNPNEVVDLN